MSNLTTTTTSIAGVSKAAPGVQSVHCRDFSISTTAKKVDVMDKVTGKRIGSKLVPNDIEIPSHLNRQDLGKALDMIRAANQPPSKGHIAKLITRLYMVTSHRTANDLNLEAMLGFYVSDLTKYPADVIEAILTSDRVWFPALADLKEEAHNHHLPRLYMTMKINERLGQLMPEVTHPDDYASPKLSDEEAEAAAITEQAAVKRHEANMRHFTGGTGKAEPEADPEAILEALAKKQKSSRKPKGASDDR